jgi:hypothetical protein
MAQAQGSRHSVSYMVESTFGTTPGSPAMVEFRHTSCTLAVQKDAFVSNEIRNDRQVVDVRHGAKRAAGDLGFELCYGAHDDWLEAALFGTWSTNVLKAGVTPKSFVVERAFADISEFQPFNGVMVNTMSLNVQPNAMVTGTFGLIGTGMMAPASSALDASITAAATNAPFDGFSGALTEGGSSVQVSALTLELNNNLAPTYAIGSAVSPQMLAGRSIVTGSVSAWFETEALLSKFLNETESALSLTLNTPGSGKDIVILIPRLKYTGAAIDTTNADDGIFVVMPFQALRDSSEATNIKITRTP